MISCGVGTTSDVRFLVNRGRSTITSGSDDLDLGLGSARGSGSIFMRSSLARSELMVSAWLFLALGRGRGRFLGVSGVPVIAIALDSMGSDGGREGIVAEEMTEVGGSLGAVNSEIEETFSLG